MLTPLMLRHLAMRRFVRRMIRQRVIMLLALMFVGCVALRARAQAVPAGGIGGMTPDQQQALIDQMQQMQAIRDQVMQNMQNAGVDPQTFMQGIQQQMQDGTLDMAGLQQQLVQKGFMTQQMSDQLSGSLKQLQGVARNASLNTIRAQLEASDDEWNVILPKLQKILDLLQDATPASPVANPRAGGGGGMGGLGGLALAQPGSTSDVARAFRDLQELLKDPNTSEDRIAAKLSAWRDLHQKAAVQLQLAQSDLVSILTLRQEAILLSLGIL